MSIHSTTDQATTVDEVKQRLHGQVAVRASDFGVLLGMDKGQTAQAINHDRLGIPTFQTVERGRHMVSSEAVIDFFAARGITL